MKMRTKKPKTKIPDCLVVVSKLKKLVKAKSGFNTSMTAVEVLHQEITNMVNTAVTKAKAEKRKTVMARDVATTTTTTGVEL